MMIRFIIQRQSKVREAGDWSGAAKVRDSGDTGWLAQTGSGGIHGTCILEGSNKREMKALSQPPVAVWNSM